MIKIFIIKRVRIHQDYTPLNRENTDFEKRHRQDLNKEDRVVEDMKTS